MSRWRSARSGHAWSVGATLGRLMRLGGAGTSMRSTVYSATWRSSCATSASAISARTILLSSGCRRVHGLVWRGDGSLCETLSPSSPTISAVRNAVIASRSWSLSREHVSCMSRTIELLNKRLEPTRLAFPVYFLRQWPCGSGTALEQ